MPPKRAERIPKDLLPLKLDCSVTFNSIGGLEEHIKCLREMVLFPLIYPDFFKRFNTRPPKGVLFHGPPGTGKTLLARALANESSLVRGKRVAFFMRKGADVMSKWYGESEKQIKLLFQQAYKMRPSIIFFDEIDALAPARSEGQGEVYASVVATMLVEMDGLHERGDVIIIGATNRPDSLDPALRRPGRLDRELYFPPPSLLARRDILAIYTRHWLPRPTEDILHHIASMTNGYLGSDLNALCSEAVLKALRRVYPQVYEGDYHCYTSIDSRKVEVKLEDLLAAKRTLLPAGARFSRLVAKHLPEQCEPLLRAQVQAAADLMMQAFPAADVSEVVTVISPSVFLVSGECAETHIAPALLADLEHCAVRELSMATLHANHSCSVERAIISIFSECRRTDRSSVIFIPNIGTVWEVLSGSSCSALVLELWKTRAAGDNVLLLATSSGDQTDLPEELQDLFPEYKNCVYRVRDATPAEVINFLTPILSELPTPCAGERFEFGAPGYTASSTAAMVPNEVIPRKRRYVDGYCRDHKRARYASSKEVGISIADEEITYEGKEERKEVCPDLAKILRANADMLCRLGLEALTDLHNQLFKASRASLSTRDRMRLPQELHTITCRYLKLAKK